MYQSLNVRGTVYNLSDIFAELARENRQDQFVVLRRDTSYAACWNAICEILDNAIDKQRRVLIPGFGSVYYRVFNLGICIPFFEIDEKFVRVYQLHSNKKKLHQRGGGSKGAPIKINRKIGSQYSGLDPTIFEIAYKRIFSKIGDAMQAKRMSKHSKKSQAAGRQKWHSKPNGTKRGN